MRCGLLLVIVSLCAVPATDALRADVFGNVHPDSAPAAFGSRAKPDQVKRRFEFALAGRMEVDRDGMSDLGDVRSSIERASGRIVAVCTEAGLVKGQITESTRYLILGTPPEKHSKARPSFTKFVSEAKKAGVEIVPLARLRIAAEALDAAGLVEPSPPPHTFIFSR